MPLVVKDRVQVTSTTTGTGTVTLGSAVSGFQDFSVIGNGNTTYYAIVGQGTTEWEVGLGTYTSSGTTLSRDTILESSNGGTAVNFSAGTKNVFVTYPAEKGVYLDASGNSIGLGTIASATLTNATGLPLTTGVTGTLPVANGGTGITSLTTNYIPYGAGTSSFASSANLTFNGTTLTANTIGAFTLSGTIAGGGNQINNIVIGNTTPLAGSFTTLSASGVATFSAGTASDPAITTTGDTNTGIFFPAADTIALTEGGVECMRIDSTGNVGIGTSSPSYKLDIASGGPLRVASPAGNAAGFEFCGNGNTYGTTSMFVGQGGASFAFVYQRANEAMAFGTNNTERMRIDSNGNVGIGVTPGGTGLLELAAGTTTVAPLEFTSGTNLTTPVAGAVEYDGTIMTATSNTNFKRGTIPLTNYTSGTGITLGTNTEATLQRLLPAANDTITLPIGTYFLDTSFIITRGASTTSATARLNILGSGNAAGNFSGMSLSAPTSGGTTGAFSFDGVNINVSNVLTAASTTSGGVYQLSLRGILKVTTAGTIVPQYNLSANINGANTVAKVFYFRLQQLDTQSAAAFGPAGTGWA